MKYHLGSGGINLPGWINVDIREPADIICDLADVKKLETGAEAIYACHVLEHFGFNSVEPTAVAVLHCWVNLLAPGGVCYISVPDLKKVGKAISEAKTMHEEWNFMKCLYGGSEYPQNRHFTGFTESLLAETMRNAGLTVIEPFEPFADDTSRFILHGCPVSLNLRGVVA